MKIKSVTSLRKLYEQPKGRALKKVLPTLEQHSRNFINTSPFAVISTLNKQNEPDCSPRGGKPGFIKIINDKTILIPDGKGNNRLDSLMNIIECGQIACLFMIPGVDETLRLNGHASLSTDESYLAMFSQEKNPPKCVIEIEIKEVYLHCAKALMRSNLWSATAKIDRKNFPTLGQMINDQLGDTSEAETQAAMLKRYQESL